MRTIAFTMRGLPHAGADRMAATAMETSLRHAWHGPGTTTSWGTATAKLWRETLRAACRAQVRLGTLEEFDPEHERACPKCAKVVRAAS